MENTPYNNALIAVRNLSLKERVELANTICSGPRMHGCHECEAIQSGNMNRCKVCERTYCTDCAKFTLGLRQYVYGCKNCKFIGN